MEWANKGINLWTVEQGEQVLTYNDGTYDIPVDTVDLLDHVIRTALAPIKLTSPSPVSQ
jgi:hypothetical protein